MRIRLDSSVLVSLVLFALAACGGGGSQPELTGVWWPPEQPRQPGRLVLAAPDEPDPLEWWRLNIESAVPAGIYTSREHAQLAEQIVAETNLTRERHGLDPVSRDTRLDRVAQAHAIDCATRDYWAHTTPEGLASRDRIRASTRLSVVAGAENSSAGVPGGYTAREIVRGWELSPGHRELLLSPAVRLIGVGTYVYSEDELQHYVQLLVGLPE
jgi:uncharacterized protein YkwD